MSLRVGLSVSAGFFASPTIHTALIVGGVVAIVAAIVGVFTVMRGQSFAGHALADLSAVGGSGAFLLGISQLSGFVLAGLIAATLMEAIGLRRLRGRDVSTGIVLALGLGVTALFLYLDTTIGNSSSAAISVLFGSLFAVNQAVIPIVVVLGSCALVIIGLFYRWLLMEALEPDLARARGIPVRLMGFVFMIALALAVVLSAMTVGAILSTALLIGPAATALVLTRRAGRAIAVAAGLGLFATWAGCFLSYESYYWSGPSGNWPVSFCIVALVFLVYLGVRTGSWLARRRGQARILHGAGGVACSPRS